MADVVLKLEQIEDIFIRVITKILLPSDPTNAERVRASWPTDGAPGWKIDEDVTFIRANSLNDPITRTRDVEYFGIDPNTANRQVTYTRVHDIHLLFYGPDSFDDADLVRHSFFLPDVKEELAKYNLFMVPDVDVPIRFPEFFNGQWWQRADFRIRFNEFVKRESSVPYIQGVDIKVYTEKGEI